MRILFILIVLFQLSIKAQPLDSLIHRDSRFETIQANTLSTHPFGVFISRINSNFQLKAIKKLRFSIDISSGNVWLPKAKLFIPKTSADQERMKNSLWHKRIYEYDTLTQPYDYSTFHADGIIRRYQINADLPLTAKSQLRLSMRLNSLDQGNEPFSLLTSDEFIEWFHSNIAGGEDPFGRKRYGLNKALIDYQDLNGNKMVIKNGDANLSGFNIDYHYFPSNSFLENHLIFTNWSTNFGFNTSPFNSSIDLGISGAIIKQFLLKNKNQIRVGGNIGLLRPNVLVLKKTVTLSDQSSIISNEFFLEYIHRINASKYFSIATTYFTQNSYLSTENESYYIYHGDRATSNWHYTMTHLYRRTSAHSLVFTYGFSNYSFWAYAREDLHVDNAPDTQVGIGLSIKLIK